MSANYTIIGQLSDLCHTNTYSSSFTINNESNHIQKEYKVGQLSMYNTKQSHDSVMLLNRRHGTEVAHKRYVDIFGLGLSSKMRCWDRRNRLKECRHLWCRLWATSSSTISLRTRWWSGSYRCQDYDADGWLNSVGGGSSPRAKPEQTKKTKVTKVSWLRTLWSTQFASKRGERCCSLEIYSKTMELFKD